MPLPWLDAEPVGFPPTSTALADPNGLLAVGGALTPDWLEAAYRRGIFPWFEEGQPVLWWTPDPRLILRPAHLHVSRSLRKQLRQTTFHFSVDTAFAEVIAACAEPRDEYAGTWITAAMEAAYGVFHEQGKAHSVEVWKDNELVGGLYGIAIGRVFFGESMFSRRDNASKMALHVLVKQLQRWGFELIDCQVSSQHLLSLGAEEISRQQFESELARLTTATGHTGFWQLDADLVQCDHAI